MNYFIYSIIGSFGTFLLAPHPRLGKIRAATILNLLLFLSIYFLKLPSDRAIPSLFLGSTFVGMNDPKIMNKKMIFMSLMIYLGLFFTAYKDLSFLGGALGSLAFLSSIITWSLTRSWSQFIVTNHSTKVSSISDKNK